MATPRIKNDFGTFEFDVRVAQWLCTIPSQRGKGKYFPNCYVPTAQNPGFTNVAIAAGFTQADFENPARAIERAKVAARAERAAKKLASGTTEKGKKVYKKNAGTPDGFVILLSL